MIRKTSTVGFLLLIVIGLCAAGEGEPCPLSTDDCLKLMMKNLKGRGIIGLDGEWDEDRGGYLVREFVKGTTAKEAGVQPGDLLIKVNGIPLADQDAYTEDAVNRRPGREMTITVLREGKGITMTVTLMELDIDMIAEEIGRHMMIGHFPFEEKNQS
jgi:C-terminal processing protease CtpA/Prc